MYRQLRQIRTYKVKPLVVQVRGSVIVELTSLGRLWSSAKDVSRLTTLVPFSPSVTMVYTVAVIAVYTVSAMPGYSNKVDSMDRVQPEHSENGNCASEDEEVEEEEEKEKEELRRSTGPKGVGEIEGEADEDEEDDEFEEGAIADGASPCCAISSNLFINEVAQKK